MECLKLFRKSSGLTVDNMAKLLDISPSLYSKVESGDRIPSGRFMIKFSKAFPSFNMNLFFK